MMRYVIRKKGTESYMDEGANWGPLDDAYIFGSLEEANDDLDEGEEVLEVRLTVVEPVKQPKNLVAGDNCPCGAAPPWHLVRFGLDDFTCRCERTYLVKDGTLVPNGTRANPFART